MALCCFIVPTLVPMWAWDESLWHAWHMTVAKYALSLNGTWSVNSAAHIWGVKPFEKYVILLLYATYYVFLFKISESFMIIPITSLLRNVYFRIDQSPPSKILLSLS